MTEIITFDPENLPEASRRMDEAETVFIDNQLRQLDDRIFDQKFEPLDGDKICPVAGGLDPDAETYSYRLRRHSGKAAYINDTPTDVQAVNSAIEKDFVRIVTGAIGYRLSDRDVRKARRVAAEGGGDLMLEASNDMACIRALNELRSNSILSGNSAVGLKGFFGNSSTPISQAATPILEGSSPDDDLAVLNAWVNNIAERTSGVERPNRFVLPLSTYNVLTSKPRSANSDTTVLQFWATNNEYVNQAGGVAAVMSAPNFDKSLLGDAQGAVGVALNFAETNVGQRVIPPSRYKVVPHGAFGYFVIYTMTHSDVYFRYPDAVHILTNMGG